MSCAAQQGHELPELPHLLEALRDRFLRISSARFLVYSTSKYIEY